MGYEIIILKILASIPFCISGTYYLNDFLSKDRKNPRIIDIIVVLSSVILIDIVWGRP